MPGNSGDEKAQEQILLAKRMFLGGCCALPWLWVCNVLYFRLQVYGPKVLLDYWPGQSPPPPAGAGEGGGDQSMENELERQLQQAELKKWVSRSTRGAVIVMGAFVAWVITFQVNKDSFESRWFVMDESQEEQSGGW